MSQSVCGVSRPVTVGDGASPSSEAPRSSNMQRFTRRQFLKTAGLGLAGLSLGACQQLPALLEVGARSTPTPDPRLADLEEPVQAFMAAHKVPGIAVGLVRDSKLVYARGFGVRDLNSGEPMTERSVMRVCQPAHGLGRQGLHRRGDRAARGSGQGGC